YGYWVRQMGVIGSSAIPKTCHSKSLCITPGLRAKIGNLTLLSLNRSLPFSHFIHLSRHTSLSASPSFSIILSISLAFSRFIHLQPFLPLLLFVSVCLSISLFLSLSLSP